MIIALKTYKQFEEHFKLKFSKLQSKRHSNGFISVTLDWSTKNVPTDGEICASYFKYVDLSHSCFGGDVKYGSKYLPNIRTASFEFQNEAITDIITKKHHNTPWFDISLIARSNKEEREKQYEYLFFNNTKYGLIAWFAPRGWENWETAVKFKD